MHLDERSSTIVLAVVTISLALAVGLAIPLASGTRPGGTPPPWTPLPSWTPTATMTPLPTFIPAPELKSPTPAPTHPAPTRAAIATPTMALASPSATPTVQPTPTATATPGQAAAAGVVLAQVSAGPLNLRAGPASDQTVIATADIGEVFTATARTADEAWLEVCCVSDKPVWLSAPLVTITGTLTSLPIKP